jgi:hypothetical protein
MASIERTPGSLPPSHRSRVDDLAYPSVSAWFDDHRGHETRQRTYACWWLAIVSRIRAYRRLPYAMRSTARPPSPASCEL